MKTLLIMIIHLSTNIIIQSFCISLFIWYYDTTPKTICVYLIVCFIVIIVDCLLSRMITKNLPKTKWRWIIHTLDLVLAIPNIIIIIEECILEGLDMPYSYLWSIITVLIINTFLIMERLCICNKFIIK